MTAGGLNYAGQASANKATRNMVRDQMRFQEGSVKEQMAFQERMSNTAYQRAKQDMLAAGLNLILAYNQGGASTPLVLPHQELQRRCKTLHREL